MSEETSNPEATEETVVETPEVNPEEPSNPAEEPHTEQPLYAGKYKSAEELERAYQEANAANSKMAQELANLKKPQIPEDKQAVIDELKSLGMVTKDELEKHNQVQAQALKDNKEIEILGLNKDQENILRAYANSSANLNKSMTECWNELQIVGGAKVVSRKTTIKPKNGLKTGFIEKSPRELTQMSQVEYDQYWKDYAAWKAGQ